MPASSKYVATNSHNVLRRQNHLKRNSAAFYETQRRKEASSEAVCVFVGGRQRGTGPAPEWVQRGGGRRRVGPYPVPPSLLLAAGQPCHPTTAACWSSSHGHLVGDAQQGLRWLLPVHHARSGPPKQGKGGASEPTLQPVPPTRLLDVISAQRTRPGEQTRESVQAPHHCSRNSP